MEDLGNTNGNVLCINISLIENEYTYTKVDILSIKIEEGDDYFYYINNNLFQIISWEGIVMSPIYNQDIGLIGNDYRRLYETHNDNCVKLIKSNQDSYTVESSK